MLKHIPLMLVVAAGVIIPATANAQGALMKYCRPDVERLCQGVHFGDKRILHCLKSHSKEVSVGCAQALQKLKQQH